MIYKNQIVVMCMRVYETGAKYPARLCIYDFFGIAPLCITYSCYDAILPRNITNKNVFAGSVCDPDIANYIIVHSLPPFLILQLLSTGIIINDTI